MIEKRFEMIITSADGSFYYLDKNTGEKITSTLKLENKLNALHEENEHLKKHIERICDDIDLALGFIQHKGYSLQDIKDYEDAKNEYEEDLKAYRKGDVE